MTKMTLPQLAISMGRVRLERSFTRPAPQDFWQFPPTEPKPHETQHPSQLEPSHPNSDPGP